MSAYLFNLARTNASNFSNLEHSSFDCLDVNTGLSYQIKAVSTITADEIGGPTSFGPRSEFDKLLLVHVICEENRMLFFDCTEQLDNIMVNKKETFKDQCLAGKRPRFSLLKKLRSKI
jgi:Bsp6I restriction endonuclease.